MSSPRTIRRLPALSKLSAWLGVVALALQTLVPLVHERPADAALSVFGGPMALCLASADGAKAPVSDHGKAPADKVQPCAICLTLQLLGGFLPPSEIAALVPPRDAAGLDRLAEFTLPVRWTATQAQPRAPPVTA